MKPIFSSLVVVALFLLIAPAFAASNAVAPSVATAAGCGVDLAQILAANQAPLCSGKPADEIGSLQPAPLDLAIGPHCCGAGAGDACRDLCKQQAPGCKGIIGCRAGECVCTCDCP